MFVLLVSIVYFKNQHSLSFVFNLSIRSLQNISHSIYYTFAGLTLASQIILVIKEDLIHGNFVENLVADVLEYGTEALLVRILELVEHQLGVLV